MTRLLLWLIAAVTLVGCTPPLGPKTARLCLNSPVSREKADDIRALLLSEAHRSGLFVRDWSDQFRKLEENPSLIFMRFREGRFMSSYNVQFNINPTRGGSSVTKYGDDEAIPQEVRAILDGLGRQFEFTTGVEGKYGNCP